VTFVKTCVRLSCDFDTELLKPAFLVKQVLLFNLQSGHIFGGEQGIPAQEIRLKHSALCLWFMVWHSFRLGLRCQSQTSATVVPRQVFFCFYHGLVMFSFVKPILTIHYCLRVFSTSSQGCVTVCCFVLFNRYWRVMGPMGFPHEKAIALARTY